MTLGPLYHWSPRSRLGGIRRLGLVPGKRNVAGPTLHDPDDPSAGEFRQPCVCFSLDPVTAWAYSHAVWRSTGEFDLWQVWLEPTDEVHVLPMWGGRIVEVRVHNRIPKRRLIHVGERTVHPRT
jgi:hypothetical protein